MPIARSQATQHEKYIVFKKAYGLVKHYEETNNYLAAYVIAFSILEDRVRALYVVGFRHEHGRDPSSNALREAFKAIVGKLLRMKIIGLELDSKLRDAMDERNSLLHTAMWELDAFTADSVKTLKVTVREVDALLREKKKEFGVTGKVLTA